VLKNPHSFINTTPHMSFVWGDDNIKFLKKRYDALQASPLFRRCSTPKTTRRSPSGFR
jgi:malate dehydrogenase (quinone)